MSNRELIAALRRKYADYSDTELLERMHSVTNQHAPEHVAAKQVLEERKQKNETSRFEASLKVSERSLRICWLSLIVSLAVLIYCALDANGLFE